MDLLGEALDMDKILRFYWIMGEGIPRFSKSFAETPGMEDAAETEDLLLSGFLSALMSFSTEFFEGERLSQIELLNHKFFVSPLGEADFLVLCTTMGFHKQRAYKILEGFRTLVQNSSLPSPSSFTSIDEPFLLPLLLKAIAQSVPQSITEVMQLIREDSQLNTQFLASLVLDSTGERLSKHIHANLPFELQAFLESVFWEKIVWFHFKQRPILLKLFDLGTLRQITIQTQFGTICSYLTKAGIISLVFDPNLSNMRVKGCSDNVLQKITDAML